MFFSHLAAWRFLARQILALASPLLLLSPTVQATENVAAAVTVATANEQSTLNRTTGKLTSTAEITLTNTGSRRIEPPLHAVLQLSGAASYTGLQATGAVGGLTAAPYQAFYYDLSSRIGAGLMPGQQVKFTITLVRPSTLRFSYAVIPHAVLNRDPVIATTPALSGRVGQPVTLDATGSSDPDGDALSFKWRLRDGTELTGPAVSITFASAGLHEVTLTVTDPRLGETRQTVHVSVLPSATFALARTRTLDGAGLPLGGVVITETPPAGAARVLASDAASGFASLGTGLGQYQWKFSLADHLSVWRNAALLTDQVKVLPNPWLTGLIAPSQTLSTIQDSTVATTDEKIKLVFPAGAFAQPALGSITSLNAQALPVLLPLGWSPLQAFHLELTQAPTTPGTLSAKLWEAATSTVLAQFDDQTQTWKAQAVGTIAEQTLTASLSESGTYAVIVPDSGIAMPGIGSVIVAGATAPTNFSGITATGSVDPTSVPASTNAATVTAKARVVFTSTTPMPSGTWFPTEVEEIYTLRDHTKLRTPDYDATIVAYRSGSQLVGTFPMRPQMLLGPSDLDEATVQTRVLAPTEFAGAVVDATGGLLDRNGVRFTVPPNAVASSTAGELRQLRVESFTGVLPPGLVPAKAFEFNLPGLEMTTPLEASLQGLEASSHYVLAKLVFGLNAFGLSPVERFDTDASSLATSAEPATGDRLPGVRSSGHYLVVKVSAGLGLVKGSVTGDPGALVEVSGQPWMTLSNGTTGNFYLLAPAGPLRLLATNLQNGHDGFALGAVADVSQITELNVDTAATGPRVVETIPANAATKVNTVSSITVTFSKAINPATLGIAGIVLKDPTDSIVPASLSLDAKNKTASLFPTSPLLSTTVYRIEVATTITGTNGLPIEGTRTFTFTTASPAARGEGAQLTIYEPGATQVPANILAQIPGYNPATDKTSVIAQGSQGTADPEVPVILVNETTGETGTVLSKPDGSFSGLVHAAEEDFVSAVFVNSNGTCITIPATRQQFDDGRVGLYRQGGILEAVGDGGSSKVIIAPGAISSRTVLKFEISSLAEVLATLNGLQPTDGAQIVGGVRFTAEGDELKSPAKVTLSLPRSVFNPPDGKRAEDALIILANVAEVDGKRVFSQVDPESDEFPVIRQTSTPPAGAATTAETLSSIPTPAAGSNTIDERDFKPAFAPPAEQQESSLEADLNERPNVATSFAMIVGYTGGGLVIGGKAVELPPDAPEPPDDKPVAGAFIVAQSSDSQNARTTFVEGQLGTITSGTGNFHMFLDRGYFGGNNAGSAPINLAGFSTKYPFSVGRGTAYRVANVGFGLAARKGNVRFQIRQAAYESAAEDKTRPVTTFRTNPLTPFAQGESTKPFQLRVSSFDREDHLAPKISVILKSVAPADKGNTTFGKADVVLTKVSDVTAGETQDQVWNVTCKVPARLNFEITSVDNKGNGADSPTPFAVNVIKPILVGAGAVGPWVVSTDPQNGAKEVPSGNKIRVEFSRPMDSSLVNEVPFIFHGVPVMQDSVHLSEQNTVLELVLDTSGLLPGAEVVGSFNSLLKDTAENFLDQDTIEVGNQPFTFSFTVSSKQPVALSFGEVVGVVGDAEYKFVVDRRSPKTGNAVLQVWSTPANQSVTQLGEDLPLLPFPRDVLYLGPYEFRSPAEQKPRDIPQALIRRYERLLVVTGGQVGIGQDPWLAVVDVSAPANPKKLFQDTLAVGGLTTPIKLVWSPPKLDVLLLESDSTNILEIDLQLLLWCKKLTDNSDEPEAGFKGVDLDGDGDYADNGEKSPRPFKLAPKVGVLNAGAVGSISLPDNELRKQRLVDFDAAVRGELVVGASWSVAAIPPESFATEPPKFWVLQTPLSKVATSAPLPAEPTRLLLLPRQSLELPDDGGFTVRDIALVSLTNGKIAIFDLASITSSGFPISIPSDDGNPKSMMLGQDGKLYISCAKNFLVLDPTKLLIAQKSSINKALTWRIPRVGTSNRHFIASDIQHMASGNGAILTVVGDSFPPPPEILSVQAEATDRVPDQPKLSFLVDTFVAGVSLYTVPYFFPPLKTSVRKSKNGILELVDPSIRPGDLRFDPVVKFVASESPIGTPISGQYPRWTRVNYNLDLFGGTFDKLGAGQLERAFKIPPYGPKKELAITVLNGIPVIGPILGFSALAGLGPEEYDYVCEDKSVRIKVYSGLIMQGKVDADLVKTRFKPIADSIITLLTPVVGPQLGFKTEVKGSLAFKGQWRELKKGAEAYYGFDVACGLDPLFGLKADIPITTPLPFVEFAKRFFNVGPVLVLGGSVSLIGTVQRTEVDGIPQLTGKGATLGGKLTLGVAMKGKNAVAEFGIAAETGLSLKGTWAPTKAEEVVKIKEVVLSCEGLVLKTSFKFAAGTLSFAGFNGQTTIIEPAELARTSIDFGALTN